MSLGRSFWTLTRYARALRFWLYALLALIAFFGCNEVRAQDATQCHNLSNYGNGVVPYCQTREEAHSVVSAILATATEVFTDITYGGGQCGGGSGVFAYRAVGRLNGSPTTICRRIINANCPTGQVWNDLSGQKRCMTNCTARGTPTFQPAAGQMLPDGSIGCSDGCQYAAISNGDGTYSRNFIGNSAINHCSVTMTSCVDAGYTLNYGLGMCVPPVAECAPHEVKDPQTGMCTQGCPTGSVLDPHGLCKPEADHCPAGMVRSPEGNCLPGDGQCAAGEARKPDGTCGLDSDGDGEPDEFDEETDDTSFAGGDTCNAPPSCNGDAIMCGIARINWRIECNTRKDTTVSGGSCGAVPICIGKNCDAVEYAQLLQQWRATCALEKLAEDGIGGGDDDDGPQSCGPGMSDAQCAAGQNIGDEGDAGSVMHETEYLASGFDASGYGWGQSCPTIPPVTVFGHTLDFQSKLGPLCEWFQLGGIFLMIATGITCLVLLIKV